MRRPAQVVLLDIERKKRLHGMENGDQNSVLPASGDPVKKGSKVHKKVSKCRTIKSLNSIELCA